MWNFGTTLRNPWKKVIFLGRKAVKFRGNPLETSQGPLVACLTPSILHMEVLYTCINAKSIDLIITSINLTSQIFISGM